MIQPLDFDGTITLAGKRVLCVNRMFEPHGAGDWTLHNVDHIVPLCDNGFLRLGNRPLNHRVSHKAHKFTHHQEETRTESTQRRTCMATRTMTPMTPMTSMHRWTIAPVRRCDHLRNGARRRSVVHLAVGAMCLQHDTTSRLSLNITLQVHGTSSRMHACRNSTDRSNSQHASKSRGQTCSG